MVDVASCIGKSAVEVRDEGFTVLWENRKVPINAE